MFEKIRYHVKGLEIIDLHKIKSNRAIEYRSITYRADCTVFVIAKDSMGTQICAEGYFFPSSKSFGSVDAAVKFLRLHTKEAIEFFKNPKGATLTLHEIMMAMVSSELNIS